MANLNLSIDLTKLKGAKVMDVQGEFSTRKCVVIPIDNKLGTVCDGYISQTKEGLTTERFFDDVKLNLIAVEYRHKRHGISHGLKPAFSREVSERMTEEKVYATPWMGTVKPWNLTPAQDDDDLPAGNNEDRW